MTETRTCSNSGCGNAFVANNPRRRFCCDDCRFEAWDRDNPRVPREDRTTVESHPLDEVRAQHEKSKGRWTTIVREHLNRTLLTTGYVSAEDFDALGIPDEHHNVPGAQMGGYVSAGLMEAVTFKRWSTKAKASRKSGKYWVYKITDKGREKLSSTAGNSTANEEGIADGHSSDGTLDRPGLPEGHEITGASSSSSAVSGGRDSTEGAPPPCASYPIAVESGARLPGLEESAAARNLKDAA